MSKDLVEDFAVASGAVVSFAPPCGFKQLPLRGRQRLQVFQVSAATLVYDCVELEVDLIQPRGEDHLERWTVAASHAAGEKS